MEHTPHKNRTDHKKQAFFATMQKEINSLISVFDDIEEELGHEFDENLNHIDIEDEFAGHTQIPKARHRTTIVEKVKADKKKNEEKNSLKQTLLKEVNLHIPLIHERAHQTSRSKHDSHTVTIREKSEAKFIKQVGKIFKTVFKHLTF